MGEARITGAVIGAALTVHRELGPGLLESCYEACVAYELVRSGYRVERQKPVPLIYQGIDMGYAYRMDLLVEDEVVVELKSVATLDPIHTATVITYLRLSGHHTALLINFNVKLLRDGIRRIVL
jgi:GxxExxY protein